MTEEQLTKIAWLNRAFHSEKNAKAWQAKLERDRSLAERISRSGNGSTEGAHGNSAEDALVRLTMTEEETMARLQELVWIREEITSAIRMVEDQDMQSILVRHYLAYETFKTIADKMHYDIRTIQRKHKKALENVVIVCHPESAL